MFRRIFHLILWEGRKDPSNYENSKSSSYNIFKGNIRPVFLLKNRKEQKRCSNEFLIFTTTSYLFKFNKSFLPLGKCLDRIKTQRLHLKNIKLKPPKTLTQAIKFYKMANFGLTAGNFIVVSVVFSGSLLAMWKR